MIHIKDLTVKNFMSVGNITQTVNFSEHDLVLVLGENLDLGGNDSRNGTGKSTILNALSYALYGEALVKIRKDNLVNKVNHKGMLVTLDFSKDNVQYRIERGRKANVFRLIVNGQAYGEDVTDEAQGDSRETQAEVERILGLSHTMFKQIVALNTYNEPFLSMRSNDQRAIIEQLLGITKLSEKAEVLREQLRVVKDAIKTEEFRIKATEEANKRIEQNISSLQLKSSAWSKSNKKSLADIETSIAAMEGLDVDSEIASHQHNDARKEFEQAVASLTSEKKAVEREIKLYTKNYNLAQTSLTQTTDTKTCPTCGQGMDEQTHEQVHAQYEAAAKEAEAKLVEKTAVLDSLVDEITKIEIPELHTTFYNNVNDAYNHKATISALETELRKENEAVNPYLEQIESLQTTGLQTIDFTLINDLTSDKEHREFLLKLLTNKDSFIRKKIIDQNLSYLNSRLAVYLEQSGLPHEVKFKSDLEVEITQYGREFDFDNLSRGERTRLILSLSWAFRDVYESINDKINLLFIDELIDSGLDTSGVEGALSVLKGMNRENARNIFLISHRDELVGRVSSILKVIKENGFTSYAESDSQL